MAEDQKYLPLKEAIDFFKDNNLTDSYEKIKEIHNIYSNSKTRRKILKPFIIFELENNNLLNDFIEKYWKNGKTETGQKIIRKYKRQYVDPFEENDGDGEDEDDKIETEMFAYEEDLKNYLISNLPLIENGLKLFVDENNVEGVEYSIDKNNKRIDILAIDKNNKHVIIELKVSKGYEKVVGQCLYYKNRLIEKLNVNDVRVIIIAREITDQLKTATKGLSGFELYEYKLNVKLEKILEN